MKDQTQKFRILASVKTILLVILFALTATSCVDLMSVTAELSDNECIEVSNYISPEYVMHVRAGTLGGMKEIEYKKTKTFLVKTSNNNDRYRRNTPTHLSIFVLEKATDREVNSLKAKITFSGRGAGCAKFQMSHPDQKKLEFE